MLANDTLVAATTAQETDTIIVGAGPAGLAVGAALRRKNVQFEMLERTGNIGSSWRGHYERLHLHTPKSHSALPFVAFPRTYPCYPSRQQIVDYLDRYAREFDLQPRFGEDVLRCARSSADLWEVETSRGVWRGRHLVVATGFNRIPRQPSWPGLDSFPGTVLHSSAYANGEPFRGKRVLVVGFGNSGAEIAIDLVEHGADTTLAVRGNVNILPRDVLGIPVIRLALASRYFPPRVADRFNALAIRLAIGNLSRYGIKKRKHGPFVEIFEHRHVPVIDVGTLALIRRGRIVLRSGIENLSHDEVIFSDGCRERFDAIVLATGFETGLRAILPDASDTLDAHGRPRAYGRESMQRGLYFCGFNLVPTGFLREIAIEALRVAGQIGSEQSGVLRAHAATQSTRETMST